MILFEKLLTNVAKKPKFVRFEDENTEALCLKYFDVDKDGKIAYDELSMIKAIKGEVANAFKDPLVREIKKFNEFKFFGISYIEMFTAFIEFKNLEEIELPRVKTLNQRDFCYIYENKIKKIVLQEGLENIGAFVFMGALSPNIYVTLPSTIKSIGENAFSMNNNVRYIFKSNTPPVIKSPWGYRYRPITVGYAPDDSVAEYRQSSVIGTMCSEILPVSELGK